MAISQLPFRFRSVSEYNAYLFYKAQLAEGQEHFLHPFDPTQPFTGRKVEAGNELMQVRGRDWSWLLDARSMLLTNALSPSTLHRADSEHSGQ